MVVMRIIDFVQHEAHGERLFKIGDTPDIDHWETETKSAARIFEVLVAIEFAIRAPSLLIGIELRKYEELTGIEIFHGIREVGHE